MLLGAERSAVHFVPIATTVIALLFAATLAKRYRARGGAHLAWWSVGMLTYGLGTLTESVTTIAGWYEGVFKLWYVSGALLGGAPLAQGTVYLMLARRTADRLTIALLSVIAVAAMCVVASPVIPHAVEAHRLSGQVLEWTWVRAFSPFVNLYAVIFLVGGAIVSAARFRRRLETRHRFLGNVAIAIGAILPGVGGTFTRFGQVEVLYATEFVGLIVIWIGYRLNTMPSPRAAMVQTATAGS